MSTAKKRDADGSIAVGRYRIYGEIASGGMATVHIGRLIGPAAFSRTVAIKRLHAQFAKDPEFVAMLLDEARLAARIVHPNVVSTLDIVAEDSELFLVMDYVAGESLAQLLKKAKAQKVPLPPGVVVSLGMDLLLGLHAAHEAKSDAGPPLGIVHRDVSPQNLLVGADGVGRVVDFGVAKAVFRSTSTRDGKVKGKLSYMSPEQLQAGEVDRRSDVFSAAVVLWEAFVGKRLFSRGELGATIAAILTEPVEPPSQHAPDVPAAVDAVLLKALAKDRDERYATAGEMAEALAEALRPAGALRVSQWVREVAGESLTSRAQRVAEVESQSSSAVPRDESAIPRIVDSSKESIASAERADPDQMPTVTNATDPSLGIASVPMRTSRTPLWLALAVVVIALPIVWLLMRPRDEATTSSSAPAPAAAPSQATPSQATPSPTPAEPPVPSQPSVAVPEPSARPALAPHPVAKTTSAKTAKTAAPAPEPAKPAKNCDPPYRLDARGEKVFKPECF